MNAKDYAHMDVKLDNILYREKDGKLFLIDFGLMSHHNQIYKNFAKFYFVWPPEFYKLAFQIRQLPQCPTINDVLIKFFSECVIYLRMAGNFRDQWENQVDYYFLAPSTAIYDTNKVDVYSLGMVLTAYAFSKLQ
jgi:serine/threonine protein kinase